MEVPSYYRLFSFRRTNRQLHIYEKQKILSNYGKKFKIIDEIIERHPAYGVKKGWSYCIVGMKDSREWYYRKMLTVPINELRQFLDSIIEEESKPIKEEKFAGMNYTEFVNQFPTKTIKYE